MSQRNYFRDDPDPENDRLERRAFADGVVHALDQVRQQSKSSVTGLIGPWGSGKSTTLSMILESLRDHQNGGWTVVDLNPWMYSDAESLQLGFFVALREALPSGRKWSRKRERIGNFFTAVAPFGKVNGLAGVDASSAIDSMGSRIAGDVTANGVKAKAEKVLEELEEPMIFIMDDLDRLTPDELLMVFKLVRLVGRLPNVYYLLAYDEKTLLDLIQQTNVAAGDRVRARDYMEKIVQVRFDVPPMRPKQASMLLDEAINELTDRYEISVSQEDISRFSAAYRDHISSFLTTPRSVNRYMAQIDALYDALNDEVNFIDFCLVTFLRTFEPEVYKHIAGSWRGELLGEDTWVRLGKTSDNPERRIRWLEKLQEAHVAPGDVASMFDLLASLFPPLNMIKNNYGGGISYLHSEVERRRGVGHRDYFDRYFSFGVPGDDVADRTISNWVSRLNGGEFTDVTADVRHALIQDTARVARKLERRVIGFPQASVHLLPILADARANVEHEFLSISGSPLISIERLALAAAKQVPDELIDSAVSEMDSFEFGAFLASEILNDLRSDAEVADTSRFASAVILVLRNRVANFLNKDLSEVSQHEFRHVFHWRRAAGHDVADPIIRDSLSDGSWDPLEFAAKNVSVAFSSSGESLSDLQLDVLDEVAGLAYFYERLVDQIDAAEIGVPNHLPVSDENRKRVALSHLKRRRAADSQPNSER
ncbi:P-loop NTPase fold protein [Streptomyces sp. NPDC002680]|uniref:KAP family P-loop NTPase fold protein n=1 Tax=Streptomyces sp. NPDC002680 TaxID=3364659 RepID=UPI00367435D6